MLQFLLHPSGPLPRWIRWRLADAVAASPGIGGPAWIDSIERITQTLRERDEATEEEVERLGSDIAFWLEAERYDPEVGAPLETLLERTGRVSAWASTQSNTVESESEAAMFAAAHAQAEALLTELAELRHSGARRIARLELQRRIDEVTTDAPDPSTYEEAGHARATTAPAAVTGSWPTVVWWNLARESAAISYPWSRRELDALRASGVRLPGVDDIVRRRSREWLRPLCNAGERLVLVVHHDERGTHPLWTRIESLFDGLATVEIEPVLLRGGATLQPLDIRTRELPLRPLRAPRRWWSLPAEYPVAPRNVESYSSLSKLCDYPHEWVLQYAARLRAGRAATVMDGTRLLGNLGHRLFEEFFSTRDDWRNMPDEAVLAWVRSELPGIVEREGAVLLGHGRGVDRRRVAVTLEQALVRLLGAPPVGRGGGGGGRGLGSGPVRGAPPDRHHRPDVDPRQRAAGRSRRQVGRRILSRRLAGGEPRPAACHLCLLAEEPGRERRMARRRVFHPRDRKRARGRPDKLPRCHRAPIRRRQRNGGSLGSPPGHVRLALEATGRGAH